MAQTKQVKIEDKGVSIKQEHRERRAKAISAMGLIDREGEFFRVTSPGMRGNTKSFEVRRDENGAVVCSCPEFAEMRETGERCEHIMAVKHALIAQNTEPSARKTVEENSNNLREVNNQTELRESERSEQKPESSLIDDIADGQAVLEKIESIPLGETQGDKEMKKNNLNEVVIERDDENIDENEAQSNVLDFSSTLKELRRNVDPRLVKQREGWRDRNGNVQMVDYVEWHTVADILDDAAPNWAHTVKDIRQIGDLMTVTVAITIDGVTREGIGTGHAQNEMGIKKAEHDALKRAAVKFGIARDLYKKESDVIEKSGSSVDQNDDGFPRDPIAHNLGELVTAKQLGMIRAIAREMRIDADKECDSVMNCRTDELSKAAASSFIKHLQELQRPAEVERAPLRRVG